MIPPELIEFSNVVFRFVHVVAAIMWIGNSLLFTWFELNLRRNSDDPNSLGSMSLLHGGGVFFLEKRVVEPDRLPERLHRFLWQSYATWLSGAALLALTFYTRPGSLMLDPAKTDMAGWQAILVSAGSLVAGWVFYDLCWRSPLGRRPAWAIAAMGFGLGAYALWIDGFFNGRYVYLQIGAMLGTTMTANVFFVIIPSQRKMMEALQAGHPHDLELGRQAKFRSLSNHYLTFPVIFLMLSAHFPALYGSERKLSVLAVACGALAGIKWMMNLYRTFRWWLPVAAGLFAGGAALVALLLGLPTRADARAGKPPSEETLAGAQLFARHGCNACHQPVDTSIAPSLRYAYGRFRDLADGETVVADEAYLRESILQPQRRIRAGYGASMPSYASVLSESEIDRIVAYLKSPPSGK